jgi:hypothetical protein
MQRLELAQRINVDGGKTPGEQLDRLVRYLSEVPEYERERAVEVWVAKMLRTGYKRATIRALAGAALVVYADPVAR